MAFKNAKYWSNKEHWKWATQPNNREKASFLKENILPIEESGHLHFVKDEGQLFDHFSTLFREWTYRSTNDSTSITKEKLLYLWQICYQAQDISLFLMLWATILSH